MWKINNQKDKECLTFALAKLEDQYWKNGKFDKATKVRLKQSNFVN